MKGNVCPSCGASYNGRKCKACLYEPFTEEITHGLHTHAGEPLVIEARKPRQKPRRCERRIWKFPKWLKTAILWILLINLLPVGIEYIQDSIDRARVPEPEPVLSPLAVKLWEGEDITLWTDQATDPMEIPILVENNSRKDIRVYVQNLLLGDFQTTYSHLYVEAGRESWGRGYLYLDEEDLAFAGAGPFEEICFTLEIYDSDSYDTLYEIEGVVITLPETLRGTPLAVGFPLMDEEAIAIQYLGYEGDGSQWVFEFLTENRSDETLHLWTEDTAFDGEEADVSLWEEILPGATKVTRAYAYPEGHTIPETLRLTLHISDENYEALDMTQTLVVPVK